MIHAADIRRMRKLAQDILDLDGEDKSLMQFYAEQLAHLVIFTVKPNKRKRP